MSSIEINKTIDFFGFKDGVRRLAERGVPFETVYQTVFHRTPK